MRNARTQGRGAARTSVRLSLQFAFLYSFLTAVIFIGAHWMTDFEVRGWMRERMTSDAVHLAEIYKKDGPEALIHRIDTLVEINFEAARIFQLSDQDNRVVTGNVRSIPNGDQAFIKIEDLALADPVDEEVTGYWISRTQIGPFVLVQGTGDHVVAEVLEALSKALIGGFVVVIGLGLLAGLWIGRLTERQIEQISDTLEKVAEGDMTARILIPDGTNDDLARVADSIDATLDRLQSLMESQHQISTDIAHDMRTPLQHLRQRLEYLEQSGAPGPDDIAAALRETDEIIATFNSLLRIAQIEASDRRERFAQVDLNEVAGTVFDAFEPTAVDNDQTLTFAVAPEAAPIWGDRNLLMQLAANLVENGLRHCPPGAHISIEVRMSDQETSLWVSDDGPGIPASDVNAVFRRFYRSEKSRTSPGHGLGLSMVQAIAELHKASVSVHDNHPGLRIVVRFAAGSPGGKDIPAQV